jgi:hypothetical protein
MHLSPDHRCDKMRKWIGQLSPPRDVTLCVVRSTSPSDRLRTGRAKSCVTPQPITFS